MPGNMPDSLESSPDCIVPHTAYNAAGIETILLIHGALGSHSEWDLVVPHLSDTYHVLVPDLPGHGESRKIRPFSVEYSSRLMAKLIRKHAHNGIAHIVGLSLGADVAINLASHYPEVVNATFVSGFGVHPQLGTIPGVAHIFWALERAQQFVPQPVIRWLMDGADMTHIDTSTCTLSLCREIIGELGMSSIWPEPWPSRTLIIAAGKGGIVPSSDPPEDSRRLARIGNGLNADTAAWTHPAMRHPWHRQDPVLFAKTCHAWFEGKEMPEGFLPL